MKRVAGELGLSGGFRREVDLQSGEESISHTVDMSSWVTASLVYVLSGADVVEVCRVDDLSGAAILLLAPFFEENNILIDVGCIPLGQIAMLFASRVFGNTASTTPACGIFVNKMKNSKPQAGIVVVYRCRHKFIHVIYSYIIFHFHVS